MTTLFALPGLLYVAMGLGVLDPALAPSELRLSEKFEYVGLPLEESTGKLVSVAIGLGKVTIAANNWVIKSRSLDLLFALASIPGFGLVLYVHRMLPNSDPWIKEVNVITAPVMLCAVYYLSKDSVKKTKAKAR